MPYIRTYDQIFDESFQSEVDEETAEKARAHGIEVLHEPFPGLPIMSRYRSERHPGWDSEE